MAESTDEESLLWRFLFLGDDESVYRPRQQEIQATYIIDRLIQRGRGKAIIDWIKENKEKCCKFYPFAYTLAICAKCNMLQVRQEALDALKFVCNTPTELFMFLWYCAKIDGTQDGFYWRHSRQHQYKRERGISKRVRLRSWPRQFRRGVALWYTANPRYQQDILNLAKHVTKYQHRHGFTHKRVIKSCHPKSRNEDMNYIFCYVLKGFSHANQKFEDAIINGRIRVQVREFFKDLEELKNPNVNVELVKEMINKWDLSWEHIPTKFLKYHCVWKTFLMREMPLMALIRNLGKAGSMQLLQPGSEEERRVCERLTNIELVNNSKLHPIDIISALTGYRRGEGSKGREWPINEQIIQAVYRAYMNKLSCRPSTEKRLLIAINIKMNFDRYVVGKQWLSCKEAAIAMAMMLSENERSAEIVTFGHFARRFDVPRHDESMGDIETALERIASIREEGNPPLSFTAPFVYAEGREEPFDVIILITDKVSSPRVREIKSGFTNYKQHHSTAKCITVHFKHGEATSVSQDPSMLDVIGVDAYALEVIQDFILGYHEDMANIIGDVVDLRI
ncbi:RNA-binding protein Ro60-like [Saccostrea echinata]|uniref:RNA-binding protein Ro60-like n=1 Tax=Saccostrea echinata TaxID=191078 RepID=UPI002A82A7F5|nr:RNA-binding protein Ro60-like [Saccostrea echinata]